MEWYLVTVDWVNIAGGGISYIRLRELLLEKISQLGIDSSALHACIACGQGVERLQQGLVWLIACFKRHARWQSESAKGGYVKDSLEQRLSVTKRLGI